MAIPRAPSRLSVFFELFWNYDPRRRAEHDYRNVFLRSKPDVAMLLDVALAEASVLVLGCGYTYSDVILYSNVARRVVGLDILEAFYRDGWSRTYRAGRKRMNPLAASVRAALLMYQHRRYYGWLEKLAGTTVQHERYDVRRYDGSRMPFGDETFDAVISNAVLEHVSDLDQVAREVHRVTKRRGISYHTFHNYYSLSGGHVPASLAHDEPWGHLRGLHEASKDLNRLRPDQVRQSFAQLFEIIALWPLDAKHRKKDEDPDFAYEQPELLTGPIREELCSYSEALLLTPAFLLIARKGD